MKRTMTSVCIASSILVGISANAIAADYEWESNFALVEIIKDLSKNREFRNSATGKTIQIKEYMLEGIDRSTYANGGPLIVVTTPDYGREMMVECVMRDNSVATREAQNTKRRTVTVSGVIKSVGDSGVTIDPCIIIQ